MRSGGRWEDVLVAIGDLSPGLRVVVKAQPLFAKPVTIANLPYGHVHEGAVEERIYRLGDQAAMTASLTGDGMAIALRSGWLAARCVASGLGPQVYHDRLRRMAGRQVRRGMKVQRLAEISLAAPLGVAAMRACPGVLRALVGMTRLPQEKEI